MHIEIGDYVFATVKQINQGEVHVATDRWDNISKFVLSCDNSNIELFPGKSLPVDVNRIAEKTVYATPINAPYARYVWPGDILTTTITHFDEGGLAIGEYDNANCHKIRVPGAVPKESIEVRILKLSDGIATGEIINKTGTGIKTGELISATIEKQASVAKPKDGSFEIYLPIDLNFEISSEVTVRVTGLDGKVDAKIQNPGRLPIPGRQLRGSITRGSNKAEIIDGSYEVELSSPALATGGVQVRIEGKTQNTSNASISSYEGLLPSVGDEIKVWSVKEESEAVPEDGSFRVELPATIPVQTQFTADIESIDTAIKGDVADVGSLPVPGNTVEVECVRGEQIVNAIEGGYPIEIRHPALVSGQLVVSIDSSPEQSDDVLTTGHIESYDGMIPSVGTVIDASCTGNSSIANPTGGDYRIQLPIEAPIDSDVTVEILSITPEGVSGRIVDAGVLPLEGNKLLSNVTQGEQTATCQVNGYEIELCQPSLVTGEVMVTILSRNEQRAPEGTISSHCGLLPDRGDIVKCRCSPGSTIVEPLEGTYSVTLDEKTPVEATIDVKITEVGTTDIQGKVVDNGIIPKEGNNINGMVNFGKKTAKANEGYQIHVTEPASASGNAKIRIESVTTSTVQGTIIDNQGLPEIGETLYAKVGPQRDLAEPLSGEYQIHLRHPSTVGRTVFVEITRVNDKIHGKVVKRNSGNKYMKEDFEYSESKNDLITGGKMS